MDRKGTLTASWNAGAFFGKVRTTRLHTIFQLFLSFYVTAYAVTKPSKLGLLIPATHPVLASHRRKFYTIWIPTSLSDSFFDRFKCCNIWVRCSIISVRS